VISNQQILNQLHWRYATKKFDANRKISFQDWQTLSESLRLAPSSYGLQPWKFIVVQDPELRKRLQAVSRDQSQVSDCSHFVVFCFQKAVTDTSIQKHLQRISNERGVTLESLKEYAKGMVSSLMEGPRAKTISFWAQRQSYIAMGFLMMTAGLLEIDTCPMEGLDPLAYEEILGLKNSEFGVVAAVAIGYRSAGDKYAKNKKVRFATEQIIEFR